MNSTSAYLIHDRYTPVLFIASLGFIAAIRRGIDTSVSILYVSRFCSRYSLGHEGLINTADASFSEKDGLPLPMPRDLKIE